MRKNGCDLCAQFVPATIASLPDTRLAPRVAFPTKRKNTVQRHTALHIGLEVRGRVAKGSRKGPAIVDITFQHAGFECGCVCAVCAIGSYEDDLPESHF